VQFENRAQELMKKLKKILGITFLLILQSCYFGAGLVEQNLPDDFFLFANSSLDEMSIWFHAEEYSNQLIVPETVFAVGYNNDFIIAKSHPKDLENGINKRVTNYHIIIVNKKSPEQSTSLTLEQFEYEKKRLNIPDKLDFHIVYEALE